VLAAARWLDLEIDPAARFCRATACDFNGDLETDVRDLVLMLRCMQDTLNLCGNIDRSRLDCDADGDRDIDDVLCARGPARAGAAGFDERRAGARRDAALRRATVVAGGIDIPVTLTGGARSAARLAFDYPDAAFESGRSRR
jgi:hypothetical protein